MRHELPAQEDLGRLSENRATVPAVIWAIAIVSGCLLGWLEDGRSTPLVTSATAMPTVTVVAAAPASPR